MVPLVEDEQIRQLDLLDQQRRDRAPARRTQLPAAVGVGLLDQLTPSIIPTIESNRTCVAASSVSVWAIGTGSATQVRLDSMVGVIDGVGLVQEADPDRSRQLRAASEIGRAHV